MAGLVFVIVAIAGMGLAMHLREVGGYYVCAIVFAVGLWLVFRRVST